MRTDQLEGQQDMLDKLGDKQVRVLINDLQVAISDLQNNQRIQAKELRQSDVYQIAQVVQTLKARVTKIEEEQNKIKAKIDAVYSYYGVKE